MCALSKNFKKERGDGTCPLAWALGPFPPNTVIRASSQSISRDLVADGSRFVTMQSKREDQLGKMDVLTLKRETIGFTPRIAIARSSSKCFFLVPPSAFCFLSFTTECLQAIKHGAAFAVNVSHTVRSTLASLAATVTASFGTHDFGPRWLSLRSMLLSRPDSRTRALSSRPSTPST